MTSMECSRRLPIPRRVSLSATGQGLVTMGLLVKVSLQRVDRHIQLGPAANGRVTHRQLWSRQQLVVISQQ